MATCLPPAGSGKTTKLCCTGRLLPAFAFQRSLQVSSSRTSFGSVKDSARPISETKRDSALRKASENPNPNSSRRSANAAEGNSTSTTDPLEKAQEEENVIEYEEQESVGGKKLGGEVRPDRVLPGEERPSKTEEFWRGVLEEIQLIEWPPLQKVLGTTGVVTGIIVGSSIVLLTVNALLARLSDTIFNNAPPA